MELPFFFPSPCPFTDPFIYLWHICVDNIYQNSENITVTEGKKDLVFTYVHCISSFCVHKLWEHNLTTWPCFKFVISKMAKRNVRWKMWTFLYLILIGNTVQGCLSMNKLDTFYLLAVQFSTKEVRTWLVICRPTSITLIIIVLNDYQYLILSFLLK